MIYLYQAAFPTLGVMFYQIFIKKSDKNPFLYVVLFLFLSLSNYFIDCTLHAKEINIYQCSLTQKQRDYYFWKIHHHYAEAGILTRTSQGWLETLKCKLDDNEYYLSNAAIIAVSTGILTKSLHASAVAACITLLEKYISQFKETWDELRMCLTRVEYHVELAEFYQDVLATDGG